MSPAKRWWRCAVLLVIWSAAAGWAQPAVRVTDLNTTLEDIGSPFFTVQGFIQLGTNVLFVQDDGIHGMELWKTDGTPAGTQLVADLNPGPAGSGPWLWLDAGGRLLLDADDGVHGREPWISDGTPAGTAMLADVNPDAGSSSANFTQPWADA